MLTNGTTVLKYAAECRPKLKWLDRRQRDGVARDFCEANQFAGQKA